jgi:hypothetical protein
MYYRSHDKPFLRKYIEETIPATAKARMNLFIAWPSSVTTSKATKAVSVLYQGSASPEL